jgi:pilus assembly protein CpaF
LRSYGRIASAADGGATLEVRDGRGQAVEVERVRQRVSDDAALLAATTMSRAAMRSAVARAVREEGVLLPPEELAALARDLTDELAGLGPVERLLRDPAVSDVMVNGPQEVWVERAGQLAPTGVRFGNAEAVRTAVQRVIGPLGLRLDRAQPYVDARLPNGSRLHAVLPPLAPSGPVVTVRRFASVSHTWDDLAASGAIPPEAAAILRAAVADRRTIVYCGRTRPCEKGHSGMRALRGGRSLGTAAVVGGAALPASGDLGTFI